MISTEYVIRTMPFVVRRTVKWSECDPAGVVYTGSFAEYVLSAADLHFGRYRGEEFLLILPQAGLEGARVRAERLRIDAGQLRFAVSPELRQTISIGVAQYRVGEDVEQALERADAALYRAKQAGRNRTEIELPGNEAPDRIPAAHARRKTG